MKPIVVFCKSIDKDQKLFWAYVQMSAESFSIYQSKRHKESLLLTDYGDILVWGWGETPSPEEQEKYNLEFNLEETFEKIIFKSLELDIHEN